MTPHERFEACMKLAEFGASRHDGRREYEWKVTLGLWAVIVAAIATFHGQTLPKWLGYVTIFVFAFLWLRGVWVSNEKDKTLSLHYRRQAEQLLTNSSPTSEVSFTSTIPWYKQAFGFLFDWSMLFQLVTTIGLLKLAYLFVK